jgi:hypothetical protein
MKIDVRVVGVTVECRRLWDVVGWDGRLDGAERLHREWQVDKWPASMRFSEWDVGEATPTSALGRESCVKPEIWQSYRTDRRISVGPSAITLPHFSFRENKHRKCAFPFSTVRSIEFWMSRRAVLNM